MIKSDTPRPGDIWAALALLSRLPMPEGDTARGAAAAWAYPVAGLMLGGLAGLAGGLAMALGLPSPLTALIALAFLVVITGAMHEDGLADTADGLWGGWGPEQRLEIMRDSRIGAYGVIALILSLGARWAALWLLFEQGWAVAAAALVSAAALSRAAMPALMCALPHAREDGLSRSVGGVQPATAAIAIGVAVLAALLLAGAGGIGAVFWSGLAALGIARLARAKIGGQTGDILGATQQAVETAVLFSLVA